MPPERRREPFVTREDAQLMPLGPVLAQTALAAPDEHGGRCAACRRRDEHVARRQTQLEVLRTNDEIRARNCWRIERQPVSPSMA
jgi:hypothetical protein